MKAGELWFGTKQQNSTTKLGTCCLIARVVDSIVDPSESAEDLIVYIHFCSEVVVDCMLHSPVEITTLHWLMRWSRYM
jgi:hypothetical protein